MLQVLQILAGSWPLAFMFFAFVIGVILLYLIYGLRKERRLEREDRIARARDVTKYVDDNNNG